jgi:ABC-type Zn2+ transport system substrate-binding protein/surface adhesin
MNPNDFDANTGHDHDHDHDHEHEHEHEVEEALGEALELDTQSQIFLQMRRQNLDLLRLATEVAGYGGTHAALKKDDVKGALQNIWEVFSEFYTWIDPEEAEDDEEEE